MKIPEKGVVYKTSRVSYMSNYILLILFLLFLSLLWPYLNLNFYMIPKTPGELFSTMVIFVFILIATFLVEEPTVERIVRQYVVTNHEVTKIEGLLRKSKISIPYQSVADVRVEQGIIGRILNFGNVVVTGMVRSEKAGGTEAIIMKGVRNPNETYKVIQNKISLMRGAIIKEHKKE